MRRVSWRTVLVLMPALALLALALGCPNSPPSSESGGGAGGDEVKPKVSKEKKEVESTGWGNLKGKVTLDGPPPTDEIKKDNEELRAAIESKKENKDNCLTDKAPESDKEAQAWRISKDGAVQNVVVFLKPPQGTVFKIDLESKTWPEKVVIEQPFCAFHPHVTTVFPSYYDLKSKAEKPSGQKFEVTNNASFSHNTQWKGDSKNAGNNVTLPPKETREINVVPSYTQPLDISCQIHQWMRGYAWAFDHPYAAVTDKDGNYEIKHAPAGAEVNVVVWHEKAGWVNSQAGEKIKLEDGKDTPKDFKLKAK
jgi:hypothetical protein